MDEIVARAAMEALADYNEQGYNNREREFTLRDELYADGNLATGRIIIACDLYHEVYHACYDTYTRQLKDTPIRMAPNI